jgi:hypothetical protein
LSWELPSLRGNGLGYLVADRRRVSTDPGRGSFFYVPGSQKHALRPPATMHKFGEVPLGRTYDSGNIVVFDLRNRP